MSKLFTPIKLGKLQLPNRIIIAPMCQYSAQDGKPSEWHTIHYGNFAISGVGMCIIEATAVEDIGRISPHDLGLWDNETEQAMASLIKAIRLAQPSTPIAIQLAHAGRKASTPAPWQGSGYISSEQGGWPIIAPSALPFFVNDPAPDAMSTQQIRRVIDAFAESAKRAMRIGVDAIELHSAHGYLLHEFLSPLTNQRTDEYGGSLENRIRFALEVFSAMRQAVPQLTLGIRISATDWVDGGWDLEQSVYLAKQLKAVGCDFIHVSSGGLVPDIKIPTGPNYQVCFAERIKAEAGIPTIAVGMITDPIQAEAILHTEQADMVALGRMMMYNPRWPWQAAVSLGAQLTIPKQLRFLPLAQQADNFKA